MIWGGMRGEGGKENPTSSIQAWHITIFFFFEIAIYFNCLETDFGSSLGSFFGSPFLLIYLLTYEQNDTHIAYMSKVARNWRRRFWMAPKPKFPK